MQLACFAVLYSEAVQLLVSGLPAVGLGSDQQLFEELDAIAAGLTAQ